MPLGVRLPLERYAQWQVKNRLALLLSNMCSSSCALGLPGSTGILLYIIVLYTGYSYQFDYPWKAVLNDRSETALHFAALHSS